MEQRLLIFQNNQGMHKQGFIVAEQEVLFEVTRFMIVQGLVSLIATLILLPIHKLSKISSGSRWAVIHTGSPVRSGSR